MAQFGVLVYSLGARLPLSPSGGYLFRVVRGSVPFSERAQPFHRTI